MLGRAGIEIALPDLRGDFISKPSTINTQLFWLVILTAEGRVVQLYAGHLSLPYFGQAARSFAAISLYSASGSFLLGAGVPGAFPPKEGMT